MRHKHRYPPWIDDELKRLYERLDSYYAKEKELLDAKAVKSYRIGTRSLERYDASLKDLWALMDSLRKRIAELEAMKCGNSARKAVGVLPRDW